MFRNSTVPAAGIVTGQLNATSAVAVRLAPRAVATAIAGMTLE
ncbi:MULTISPECIES: hypothetical protein [Amycolatopsis]|uniref:Uncharacterized protein n=1 Tax=Amycolatopsis albidoflavus TaxID=102226 RepID=A0ABW5I3X4_9PSEU